MTVSVTIIKDRKGPGDGVTTVHSFNIPGLIASYFKIQLINRSDDSVYLEPTQGSGTSQYSVVVSSDYSSITITLGATLAAAFDSTRDLLVYRDTPRTQTVSVPYDNNLPPKTAERSVYDKVVMMMQEVQETIERCLKVPVRVVSGFSGELPSSFTGSGGKAIIVNSTEDGFTFTDNDLTTLESDIATVVANMDSVVNAANNIPKANRTATTNPTVNDDVTLGYSAASIWVNINTNTVFMCTDSADGAAVWVSILTVNEYYDNLFRIFGSSDATKKVAFEVDGLTTATTRTVTIPDKSGTMAMTNDALGISNFGGITGTPSASNFMRGDGTWAAVSPPLAVFEDQKASGTNGGTATSGSWFTRTINTTVSNGIGASLSSNQITLVAGTYEVFAQCSNTFGQAHQARLQNITDATTTILGPNISSSNASGSPVATGTNAIVQGTFTIAGSKAFELQHRVQATRSGDGLGLAGSWGTEVYATVYIKKVA